MNEIKDTVASPKVRRVTEATRIPMSVPQLKLQVPDLPGYNLHWFKTTNVESALRAGYEFVDETEVEVVNTNFADNLRDSGSTDLGSRLSVSGGGLSEMGGAERLYLMKLRQDWWESDQKALEDKSDQVAVAMRGGADVIQNPNGSDHRYIPAFAGNKNLFTKKRS